MISISYIHSKVTELDIYIHTQTYKPGQLRLILHPYSLDSTSKPRQLHISHFHT